MVCTRDGFPQVKIIEKCLDLLYFSKGTEHGQTVQFLLLIVIGVYFPGFPIANVSEARLRKG
jgi:hypothetical protein